MEFELWWLVFIPVLFFMGWFAARLDVKQLLQESNSVPDSYFRGIDFLLNEEKDKAIETLTALADLDQESVELQFLVGKFFRQRGEVQRAIAIHKNLLDRLDLNSQQRLRAIYEMGINYYSAGLLDRAEHFLRKVSSGSYRGASLEALERIYVREKDWHAAIETSQMRQRISREVTCWNLVHYICELGHECLSLRNFTQAKKWFESALEMDPNCVRAMLGVGDAMVMQGANEAAIEMYKKAGRVGPTWNFLVAKKIFDAILNSYDRDQALRQIKEYMTSHPSIELLELIFINIDHRETLLFARDVIRSNMEKTKDLLWLNLFLQRVLIGTSINEHDFILIKKILKGHVTELSYSCGECGFKAKKFHWQCPACSEWQTFSAGSRVTSGV